MACVCCVPLRAVSEDKPAAKISKGSKDGGFVVHSVSSACQSGTTKIRVLLPDCFDGKKTCRVVYVLPVEAGEENRYGDGLREVQRLGLHKSYPVLFVAPTFSHLPWYADHPTDRTIRQEAYLLKVVLPFIEKTYPVLRKPEGRLLVGFSKSGWGAYSLLLRHPDVFGRAAAWDAPLMKDKPNQFGMGPIFGTQKNFESYRISALLRKRAKLFSESSRLVLTGYGSFRKHHQEAINLMKQLGIRCEYRDGPKRKHHWTGGWLKETVELLVNDSSNKALAPK